MFKSLTKKKDFEKVAKKGRPFFAKELGFKIIQNTEKHNRYGIVVSLQVDKRATLRNKIRRQIKEIVRLNNNQLKQGFDIMFLVRASVKELKYKQMEERLLDLFKKAKIVISNYQLPITNY